MSRKTAEIVRYLGGWTGGLLWMTVSTFPLFGDAAKRDVRCRGRVFEGIDDCFPDMVPILEILAPFVALALLWIFLRFSFTLWAPEPSERALGWKLAGKGKRSGYFPLLQIAALAGAVWAVCRAATYPLDPVTLPYIFTWVVFAVWFIGGVVASATRSTAL